MTTVEGPGLIDYILLQTNMETDEDQFKPPIKYEDCRNNQSWYCGECGLTLPEHKPDCPVHAAHLVAEKEKEDYVRPEWQCDGCDQPKEGPHRFSCYSHGAYRVVLPVTSHSDGTFSVDPPYSSKP